jgi:zinc D-Ala-D-Ala dipeptidase
MPTFFQELESYRQKPIPDLQPARERQKNYRTHPIDRSSALYGDAVVDIREFGIAGENFYNRCDNPPYYVSVPGSIDRLLLRKSVATRLAAVDRKLRRCGLKVHVHDAIRPTDVQRYFHDEWMYRRVAEKFPDATHEQKLAEVEKYWAAPTRSEDRPAPHSTGGAVDLTIYLARNSEPRYMGSIFDDATALAHTDHFEQSKSDSFSDAEARSNRRLIYWLMIEEGFSNHPNEWWHFSWGDQMWAQLTGAPAAFFGPAKYD